MTGLAALFQQFNLDLFQLFEFILSLFLPGEHTLYSVGDIRVDTSDTILPAFVEVLAMALLVGDDEVPAGLVLLLVVFAQGFDLLLDVLALLAGELGLLVAQLPQLLPDLAELGLLLLLGRLGALVLLVEAFTHVPLHLLLLGLVLPSLLLDLLELAHFPALLLDLPLVLVLQHPEHLNASAHSLDVDFRLLE